MKTPTGFDQAALLCVSTPAAADGFHPRRMPSLAILCPAQEGAAQRYRGPLWRPFGPAPGGGKPTS